ncbi:glutamate receptor 2.8-like isoform X4 [Macadamia integrifolia]|uniref:glutamate receptor 2.8-like isoform X4 n=1 Tax=Macadamia integrifolia TaxID=60698 RepID=UPI001C4FB83A|nr:glutamate receptor 2.8-like isoform X4 [Macadamia integrifolia]
MVLSDFYEINSNYTTRLVLHTMNSDNDTVAATSSGFVYIGVVVWILEHPTNTEFGASHRERIEKSIWYSFSTLVFSQRGSIENNLTRAVLITWVFFVLILTQCYTASLSSKLTVQQLQPTITDLNDIKNNGYYVGHQYGSFVKDFLIDHLHLDKSKVKSYKTPDEYHYALSNGTDNGGVAAIFDELPYVQVFLNMYCNRYTTVGRTYSSEGFGFVFPKGSPLVSYMSRAIVNITDDGTLDKIKQRWLQNQTNCNNNADVSSTSTNQLTLRSPGGLFLIIGVISGLSLLIHLFLFVYGSWHVQTTRMFLRSSWRNVRHMIIYITNSLRRRYHVTEVGPMESQPTVTRDIEEGTVKEEFGSMELQQRGAKHREEPIVEECIVEGGGIVEEENTVEGLSRRCLKVNIDGTDYDHYPRLPITNNVARWTSIRPWKYCQECITPLWKNKNETTY